MFGLFENIPALPEGERRKYPRLQRPVFYRVPSRLDRWEEIQDVSLGGCRIYSDQRLKKGRELIVDILMPDKSTMRARAEVVWIARAQKNVAARWEIGLQFISFRTGKVEILKKFLEASAEA